MMCGVFTSAQVCMISPFSMISSLSVGSMTQFVGWNHYRWTILVWRRQIGYVDRFESISYKHVHHIVIMCLSKVHNRLSICIYHYLSYVFLIIFLQQNHPHWMILYFSSEFGCFLKSSVGMSQHFLRWSMKPPNRQVAKCWCDICQ